MRRSIRPGLVEVVHPEPEVPAPLKSGTVVETCKREQLPTVDALKKWLLDRGLDTSDWGSGNTKSVKKLWEEIAGDESGLELWRKADGELQPVRVTHVLRAKVCSPDSHKRGVFLLNTWQQYGDGRKRIRNGLLSEKLTISEMPLERNLHAVCARAVTEEEMQRVAESLFRITPTSPAPAYDPSYVCPLEVVDEYFDDHVIEVEASKSYPRLLTLYHLYTVDILCTGLPSVDFNTLEFEHGDANGVRKLKYVHAWVWTEWPEIQRYLFEGSTLKERKTKGSFDSPDALHTFLQNFNLDLAAWGQNGFKPVEELWEELENEESQLEMWGRTDGVPLLMRVLHVLQLKVSTTDPRMRGKFLYQTWAQAEDGLTRSVNRLMSAKLCARDLPFNRQRFVREAKEVVKEDLTYLVDSFFNYNPQSPPCLAELDQQSVEVRSVDLVDHRVDVVDSPTFKGLCTLYHLYTCNVEVVGLPLADFASLEVPVPGGTRRSSRRPSAQLWPGPAKSGGLLDFDDKPFVRRAMGWSWVTWPQCLDMVHSRTREMEDKLALYAEAREVQSRALQQSAGFIGELSGSLTQMERDRTVPSAALQKAQQLLSQLQQGNEQLQGLVRSEESRTLNSNSKRNIPPSMVSEMAEKALISDDAFMQDPDQVPLQSNIILEAAEKHPSRLWCGGGCCAAR